MITLTNVVVSFCAKTDLERDRGFEFRTGMEMEREKSELII